MVKIRLYIEGGGDGKETKAKMRKGFRELLKQFELDITMCGPRNRAFRDFKTALKSHPNDLNILLVDAEVPVTNDSPWQHLKLRDDWDRPPGVDEDQCHLMVQLMEAWLIADVEALKQYYGQNFLENAIPKTSNVETIDKPRIEKSLQRATRSTTKGEYEKIKHASKLLAMLDVAKVRQASPSCDRLFTTLDKITKL